MWTNEISSKSNYWVVPFLQPKELKWTLEGLDKKGLPPRACAPAKLCRSVQNWYGKRGRPPMNNQTDSTQTTSISRATRPRSLRRKAARHRMPWKVTSVAGNSNSQHDPYQHDYDTKVHDTWRRRRYAADPLNLSTNESPVHKSNRIQHILLRKPQGCDMRHSS